MPFSKQKSKVFNAKRFAALWAGFDLGNASEEEALSKGRAIRQMAADIGIRVIDLFERSDVKKAIDSQLQPIRQENLELHEALEEVAALREELTERTRDVRKLVELLAAAKRDPGSQPATRRIAGEKRHTFGAQSWLFEVAVVGVAIVLMAIAAMN